MHAAVLHLNEATFCFLTASSSLLFSEFANRRHRQHFNTCKPSAHDNKIARLKYVAVARRVLAS